MVALTDTSDYQQLPKEEQQICDFIQDNYPAVGGRAARGEVLAGLGTVMGMAEPWTKRETLLSSVCL